MKSAVLLGLLLSVPSAWSADDPVAVKAWFTEAQIPDSVQMPKPVDALPDAPGTAGRGVVLERAAPIENPLLSQANGYIGFWIQPKYFEIACKRIKAEVDQLKLSL